MAIKIAEITKYLEEKLNKYSNFYPDKQSIQPIIENIVKSVTNDNKSIQGISNLEVQTNVENNSYVYFQLIVDSNNYTQLINEPQKSQIINQLKTPIETALKNSFQSFIFHVKIGIFPA